MQQAQPKPGSLSQRRKMFFSTTYMMKPITAAKQSNQLKASTTSPANR